MVWGSEWKLNLLDSVLEDGAYKARIFAVIDIVWAESPGKYFTEVHLVSLLTVSFELTCHSLWSVRTTEPTWGYLSGLWMNVQLCISNISVRYIGIIASNWFLYFFLNVYIVLEGFMKLTHGGLCKSQTELGGTAGQSQ